MDSDQRYTLNYEEPENLDTRGCDDTDLERWLSAAACDDIIAALPDRLDTLVTDGGTRFSGGQRQRLVLARAYATEARVLVLNEPCSAVDAVTEQRIAEQMRVARDGLTTIVITTSPLLLAACDRVIEDARVGVAP